MLFLLTGDVQIGKTRWLERLVAELAADGVESRGVLAPGVWRPRADGDDGGLRPPGSGEGAYETLGIDNVLLPDGERVAFARRRDLARAEGSLDPESQSEAAQLAWHISDDALARVNAHFGCIAEGMCGGAEEGKARPGLLVVDELGRLELERGCGLVAATELLARGATARFPHALAVVRDWLLPRAFERFGAAWGGARAISPDDEARGLVRAACGFAS